MIKKDGQFKLETKTHKSNLHCLLSPIKQILRKVGEYVVKTGR
jgi:hypothetical protein